MTRATVATLGSVVLLLLAGCDVRCAPSCSTDAVVVVDRESSAKTTGGSAASACPGPTHSGTTDCFPSTCSAGQYCDDPVSECRPGCVTDSNCGPRDVCVRADGATIGRCESCAGFTFEKSAKGCVVDTRSGTTACFPGECPVGQYCVDGASSHCQPGCVSDENCGPAERCDRAPAATIGVCTSCFARVR